MVYSPVVSNPPPSIVQPVVDASASSNRSVLIVQNTSEKALQQSQHPLNTPVEITPDVVQRNTAKDLGAPQSTIVDGTSDSSVDLKPPVSITQDTHLSFSQLQTKDASAAKLNEAEPIHFGLTPVSMLVTSQASIPPATLQGQLPAPTLEQSPPPTPNSSPPSQSPPEQPSSPPSPPSPSTPQPTPNASPNSETVVEVTADSQEYDTMQRVLTAVGNVLLRYQGGELKADRVQSLASQQRVIAEGNVQLTRGEQVLLGDRLEYDLRTKTGIFFKPSGTIFLPSASRDFAIPTPTSTSTGSNPLVPLNGTLQGANATIQQTRRTIQRLRFSADRITFSESNWQAINVRITNDPFSPAELELRADLAQLTHLATQADVVALKRPRLVFDQRIAIPIPKRLAVLGSQRQDPFGVDFGFDDRDRGGLYLGRRFTLLDKKAFTLSITPQFFIERAIVDRDFDLSQPDIYGLTLALQSQINDKTRLTGFGALRSFDFPNIGDNLRAGVRLQRAIGDYQLALEGAYRERVLNGTLGERTVQNRIGAIFSSPGLTLGNTGIDFSYRLAGEYITAETDRTDPVSIQSLGRVQGAISLRKPFTLWQGKTLPPTATEGLRYTPEPIQPYLRIVASATGVASGYSDGNGQGSLIGKIQLEGQFGHFSRPYLDYTGFFIGFSQGLQIGDSPFLYDRVVDRQVLSFGFLQHLFGPIRAGLQTSLNAESGEFFNTDIILDYSRRTYGLSFRYNPNLQVGSIVFRINSFNWLFNRDPLTSPETGVVESGVEQTNDPF